MLTFLYCDGLFTKLGAAFRPARTMTVLLLPSIAGDIDEKVHRAVMLLFIADSRFKRCQLALALELAIKPVVALLLFRTTDQQKGLVACKSRGPTDSRLEGSRVHFCPRFLPAFCCLAWLAHRA
jgi:hypothetical protein